MKNSIVSVLFVCFCLTGYSQNGMWNKFPKKSSDSTQTIKTSDSSLLAKPNKDTLQEPGNVEKHIPTSINKLNELIIEEDKHEPGINGYTILLYSGSGANSKHQAHQIELKFLAIYPDMITHLNWKNPNYEVRVGDFRTKLEAEKVLVTIQKEFPTAFVRGEKIALPPLKPAPLGLL